MSEDKILAQNDPVVPPVVDTGAPPPAPSKDWPWWWSTDEERYRGPCSSRADAIMEAWGDTAGETQVVFICQATQEGALHTDIFDGWRVADLFDDQNEEARDPDGDALSADVKQSEWDALAKRLNAQVAAFCRDHGLKSWAFRDQTKREEVDLSVGALVSLPWLTRLAVAELTQALADPAATSVEYFDGLISEVRRLGPQAPPPKPIRKKRKGDGGAKQSPPQDPPQPILSQETGAE